jgi:enamine deaminase RidA (YjgF/YER057c/UK114 family)
MSEKAKITRLETSQRLSRAVKYGGLVFLSGITAAEGGSDIGNQTRKVLEKMDDLLARSGTDKTRLLSVQIWLRDAERDLAGMNEVWNAWTPKDGAPARACGESRLADPAVLVEMIAIAAA